MDTKTKQPFETESLPIVVSGNALREVLQALNGPPHLIRELQCLATSSLTMDSNPIIELVRQFNAQVEAQCKVGSHFGWIVFPSLSALHMFEIGYSRFLYHHQLKRTNPPIFGYRDKAIEFATKEQKRWRGIWTVICVSLDDFRYEEAGDYVWPESGIKIRPERVLPTDITVIR